MSGVVVVGAGQAASVLLRSLRRAGYTEPVVLIGDEKWTPYQRPPLSKEYLADPGASVELVTEDWMAANGVELVTGTPAVALDAAERRVDLADGRSFTGDHIVLATGCGPRRLPGVEGERVHYLRTRDDADRLRAVLRPGARLIVVGAGFIGAEVASAARDAGAEVTVLEAAETPLVAAIGPELGAWCAGLQRAAGVDLRLGQGVTGVTEHPDRVVVSTTGGDVEGDAVLVAIGTTVNDALAREAGLAVDGGIVVDESGRTSASGIYAVGDVARHLHPLYGEHIRVEHYDSANHMAGVVAKVIAGKKAAISSPPWFWSDQFGRNLQWAGRRRGDEELVYRGSPDDETWSAYFVKDGVIRAAFGCDAGEDIALAKELMALQIEVDPSVLADPETDLMSLLEEPE